MQVPMEMFNDGHTTYPIPETWLQDHPCPAQVEKGCKRCWIDYCTDLTVAEIATLVEEEDDHSAA